ncbi:DUF4279 domain-containing protein [Caballeronia sp. SL2Y3]|uniref:DUF4279 domain-containing protein n=1 Tax=Caballeronia sp. SL2Y3 TaxID=2878151 RepID=UPI001FD04C48|nr:DUF4279 domain-containing protein [Caballeronia sp. SL2Y3]
MAYASFSIYQDVEPPEFWTGYFGLPPSTTGVKGQPRLTLSGGKSAFPWRQGYWSVSSKDVVSSDYLSPHLRYLVSLLGLPRGDLRAQIERQHAQVRFFCYWNNADGNRVPDVPPDIRRMADATGIEIDIDEYR